MNLLTAYPILVSLVTPRPIALVTTLNDHGQINAPRPSASSTSRVPARLICAFAPGDRDDGTPKDTALNIRSGHEFVGNLGG